MLFFKNLKQKLIFPPIFISICFDEVVCQLVLRNIGYSWSCILLFLCSRTNPGEFLSNLQGNSFRGILMTTTPTFCPYLYHQDPPILVFSLFIKLRHSQVMIPLLTSQIILQYPTIGARSASFAVPSII